MQGTDGSSAAWARVAASTVAARAAGGGPVCAYVYDLEEVRQQARAVRAALPSGWSLFYAMKANAHRDVMVTLSGEVDGFEVASLGEMRAALRASSHASTIFSGPGKTDLDIEGALRRGVQWLNVESLHELRRVALIAEHLGVVAPVALRVNRQSRQGEGSHHMMGPSAQFGLDLTLLPDAVELARSDTNIDLLGFHLHALSNNTDAAAHARFLADCVTWSLAVAEHHHFDLRVVDCGGGIGVDYRGGASPFDLERFGREIAEIVTPPGTAIVLELGRYLVAAAGWYAAEVLDVRRNSGRWFVVIRGGMHHFRLPSAWRHDHPFRVVPVDDWRYPFARPEATNVPVDVVGELCTPRDVLARSTVVDSVRAGDIVVFPLAGAYGWEISHRDFLQHPNPQFLILPTSNDATGGPARSLNGGPLEM